MTSKVIIQWPYPGARRVLVAGTFNGWKPTDMKRSEDGQRWSLEVELTAGRHEFKFVVNDTWAHDERQRFVKNEMGSFNNVLEVASPGSEKVIEIERKFSVPANFEEILISKGFTATETPAEKLCDEYFDNNNYDLLQRDHWFRKRNMGWELKHPVGSQEHKPGSSTLYHEATNEEEILSNISKVLDIQGSTKVDDLIFKEIVVSYAKLGTQRSSYKRENVNVVVDQTDWNFRIGEIEVVVHSHDEVAKASRMIDDIAKELGVTKVQGGKLTSYLKLNNPKAYQLITQLGKK